MSATPLIRRSPISRFLGLTVLALAFTGGAAQARQGAGKPAAGATSEKALLATFQKSFEDKDSAKRVAAVESFGAATRGLPDKGVGKKVAQSLVKGLEDEAAEVRAAALGQLGSGRDVDITLAGLDAFLRAERERVEHAFDGMQAASSDPVSRGTVLFRNGCFVLANYKDDRSAATLIAQLRAQHANTKDSDLATRVIGPLATGALAQGSLEAVEAVVKATKTFSGPLQEPAARELHAALAEFATKAGTTPPEWSEQYAGAWQTWLEANLSKLPKKLGHLATPPMDGPLHGLDGLPAKSG